MDAIQFDALTKAWIAEASRRRTLAGTLAAALGALGLAHAKEAAAAKSGKCKKKCGECESCKKGACKKKDGKKRCKKGKCKPVETLTPCRGGDGNCVCFRSVEGDPFCANGAKVLCSEVNCASSGECTAGHRCVRCLGSGFTICLAECGSL